jgi:hypothetical protein
LIDLNNHLYKVDRLCKNGSVLIEKPVMNQTSDAGGAIYVGVMQTCMASVS